MLSNIIGSAFLSFVAIIIWSRLYGEKLNFKDWHLYVGYLVFVVLTICNYFLVSMFLKIVTTVFIFMVVNKVIFNKDLRTICISSLLLEFLVFFTEVVYVAVLVFVFPSDSFSIITNTFFGTLIANVISGIAILLIGSTNIFRKIYEKVFAYTSKVGHMQLIVFLIIVVISYNLLFYITYSDRNVFVSMTITVITFVLYTIIIFNAVKVKNDYNSMFSKYTNTLDSLKEYEKMIDVYKVTNHENKNQLLIIRNMVNQKDSKVMNYIDNLIDTKIKDDEKLNFETSIIPEGGLRAVIYSKLLCMKDQNIQYYLNIDRKIRAVELIDLGDSLVLDICKIIGVYLDNAVEAVASLEEPMITVDLHMNKKALCIIISNNYQGTVDIDRIDDMKYTTKGEGHGYGLSLVKQILDKNHKLSNKRKLTDDVFTQELQIKL